MPSITIILVITHKSARRRESSLLDEGGPQILRGVYPRAKRRAQDDTSPRCHPERSEGSLVDFWVITSKNCKELFLTYATTYKLLSCNTKDTFS